MASAFRYPVDKVALLFRDDETGKESLLQAGLHTV